MIGTRTGVLAAVLALVLAGCGGGSGSDTVAKQAPASSSPTASASTTTAAPTGAGSATTTSRKPAKTRAHAGRPKRTAATKPVIPKTPAIVKKAERKLRARQHAAVALARLCPKPSGKLPGLPKSADGMPGYARAVLPTAQRNADRLRGAQTPAVRTFARGLAQQYDSLMPMLTQLASRSASKDELKTLSAPTARLVVALHGVALSAGAPRCGLPV